MRRKKDHEFHIVCSLFYRVSPPPDSGIERSQRLKLLETTLLSKLHLITLRSESEDYCFSLTVALSGRTGKTRERDLPRA